MEKSGKSISLLFFGNAVLIALLSLSITGALWISDEYTRFQNDTVILQENFFQQKKDLIQNEVERASQYIHAARTTAKESLHEELKDYARVATGVIENLYTRERGNHSSEQLERLIAETLRNIRFKNNRGYYYLIDKDSRAILWTANPTLEGKNLLAFRNTANVPFIRNIQQLVRKKGSGFYTYEITHPQQKKGEYTKLAYLTQIPATGWILGTGEYLADHRKEIQKRMLRYLEKIPTRHSSYLFASTYDGVGLCGPGKGENVLGITDINGLRVVQTLIAKAKAGGGFVSYVMPGIDGQKESAKLSYVLPIPDWNWYIGAGIYVGDIEQILRERQAELIATIRRKLLWMGTTLLVLLLSAVFLALRVLRKTRSEFRRFTQFLHRASMHHETIACDHRFRFSEFRKLCHATNEITLQRAATEQALHENEEYLHSLMHSIDLAILSTNAKGHIVKINPAASLLTGWNAAAALGKPIREVLHFASGDIDSTNAIQPPDHPSLLAENGTKSSVAITRSAIQTPEGSNGGEVIALRDISEEVQLLEQLQQSRKMEAVGKLAGGIAHDFNNMLGGILGAAELLQRHVPSGNERTEKYIRLIIEAAENAATLTERLLTFSRKRKRAFLPVKISDIIQNTVDLLQHTLDRRIQIEIHLDASDPVISGETAALQNVLLNLAINAQHAMPNNGTLRITSSLQEMDAEVQDPHLTHALAPGRYACLTVADTGTGITEEVLQHMFEPFFTTRKEGDGTGLGLAAVYGTIGDHNGAIRVESTLGKGTTFHLYLPLHENAL